MTAKILTVVGARPQFIKAAVVSHEIEKRDGLEEVIIHTGQHFDHNMSQTFFDELSIPSPKKNLGISGGTHAQMTARMMVSLEEALLEERPSVVLLYGDTNSTLAAALVAAKLHIPLVHVEAGARTHCMSNPEEMNRICADHLATRLLACTEGNLRNLKDEALGDRSIFVGDPMYEAFLQYREIAHCDFLVSLSDGTQIELPRAFYYLTCHREENTRDRETLESILEAMQELDAPVVYPVHPRNRKMALECERGNKFSNVLFVEPVGYLESVFLVTHAKQIVTDSGGLQREAFFGGVKCTTVLDFEVWPESMVANRNLLSKPEKQSILRAMGEPQVIDECYQPFGDGNASTNIVNEIERMLEVL